MEGVYFNGAMQRMRKQRSTGDLDKRGGNSASIRSTSSNASWISTESSQSGMTNASVHTDSNASFVVEVKTLFDKCNMMCRI
jgi:junctophilin